jgi:hypothetical protein
MERDKQAQWSDVPMAEAKLDDQTGESPLRAGMTIDDLDAASGEVHDATLAGW